ncbi:MAG TPA: hypothetical protein VGH49_07150, partial [Xanthobacteraceae bacterium]
MTARSIVACTAFAVVALLAAPALTTQALAAEASYPLGSRIGLVAPGAMKPSQTFRGFEDKDAQASMLILEIPPQAYADVEKQMSPAALTSQGMTEEKREPVTLKSGHGLLIVGQQAADSKKVRKWIFLVSTAEASALIAVQVPDDVKAKYPDADMRAALMSMTVRASVPIDEQLRLIPITFDTLSGLRAFRVVGNNAVFLTQGPKDSLEATEQPIMVISVASGGPEQATDRDNFARSLFTGLADFKDVHITGTDLLRLDNQQTHEIQAEAKDAKTDTPMKLVQWVRFGGGAFIRFVGIARADV